MPKIERLRPLLRALERLERESKRKNNGSVIVGYNASYAVFVHENTMSHHSEGQQAKFLEEPARTKRNEMKKIVVDAAKVKDVELIKGLILAGLFLQRASQELVPVDTGNLKGSAFTEKE